MNAIAASSRSNLSAFGAQGIADMAWSFAVLKVFHDEGFIHSLERCVSLVPQWAATNSEALQRGLQRFVWGLWRLSRPEAAAAALSACLEAGFIPDCQVLSVFIMDCSTRRLGPGFSESDLFWILRDCAPIYHRGGRELLGNDHISQSRDDLSRDG